VFDYIVNNLLAALGKKLSEKYPEKSQEDIQAILDAAKPVIEEVIKAGVLKANAAVSGEEAKSIYKFVSYARAALVWVCVFVFAWEYVLVPILAVIVGAFGGHLPPLPDVHITEITYLLCALLGVDWAHIVTKPKKK